MGGLDFFVPFYPKVYFAVRIDQIATDVFVFIVGSQFSFVIKQATNLSEKAELTIRLTCPCELIIRVYPGVFVL